MKTKSLLDIIEGKKRAPARATLLHLLSLGVKAGTNAYHFAYDHHFLTTYESGLPTLSVGNIVAGGGGKTPLVDFLAKELGKTKKVAILSRGYKGKYKGVMQVTEKTPAKICGDEPKLLAQKVPGAMVFVSKNRAEAAQCAREKGAEILLLDDGFQHRRLRRDKEILCLHTDNLFGNHKFLPRGLLRDSPKRLKQADLIALYGEGDQSPLRAFTDAPIIRLKQAPIDGERFAGKRVIAFCGIAHPQRFFQLLSSLGATVLLTENLPDHASFSSAFLKKMLQCQKEMKADYLVCTEKDRVKIPADFPVETLKIALAPAQGQEALTALIKEFS